jgi:hypothetical protein
MTSAMPFAFHPQALSFRWTRSPLQGQRHPTWILGTERVARQYFRPLRYCPPSPHTGWRQWTLAIRVRPNFLSCSIWPQMNHWSIRSRTGRRRYPFPTSAPIGSSSEPGGVRYTCRPNGGGILYGRMSPPGPERRFAAMQRYIRYWRKTGLITDDLDPALLTH